MGANHIRKKIEELLSNLHEAERRADAEAIQKTYEDLFSLCQRNNLDLSCVLREPRREPERAGLWNALKALWPIH